MEGTDDEHHFCLNGLSLENRIGFSKRAGYQEFGKDSSKRAARAGHKEIGGWILYTSQRPVPHPVLF